MLPIYYSQKAPAGKWLWKGLNVIVEMVTLLLGVLFENTFVPEVFFRENYMALRCLAER